MDPRDAAKVTSSALTGAFREGIAEGMQMAAGAAPHAYRVLYGLAGTMLREKIYAAVDARDMFAEIEEFLEHGIAAAVQIMVIPAPDTPEDPPEAEVRSRGNGKSALMKGPAAHGDD